MEVLSLLNQRRGTNDPKGSHRFRDDDESIDCYLSFRELM